MLANIYSLSRKHCSLIVSPNIYDRIKCIPESLLLESGKHTLRTKLMKCFVHKQSYYTVVHACSKLDINVVFRRCMTHHMLNLILRNGFVNLENEKHVHIMYMTAA